VTSVPNLAQVQALWKQQMGAAKIMWAKLTDDELLELDGRQEKLVGLIQERYAVTRAEAARQARHFFDTWNA
jgi:uncharacterized protein YjbJ (UPF0337 family)